MIIDHIVRFDWTSKERLNELIWGPPKRSSSCDKLNFTQLIRYQKKMWCLWEESKMQIICNDLISNIRHQIWEEKKMSMLCSDVRPTAFLTLTRLPCCGLAWEKAKTHFIQKPFIIQICRLIPMPSQRCPPTWYIWKRPLFETYFQESRWPFENSCHKAATTKRILPKFLPLEGNPIRGEICFINDREKSSQHIDMCASESVIEKRVDSVK